MTADLRIGLDFGGVVVLSAPGVTFRDTPDPALVWEVVPGAIDGVGALVELAGGNVWVVSKATPRTQSRSRSWMRTTGFFSATGLQPANVRFCLRREDKAAHCAELAVTHFVDDTAHVMEILRGVVPNLYRLASEEERIHTPTFARHVVSWSELLVAIGTST